MTDAERNIKLRMARRELNLLGILNNSMRGSAQRISTEELERRIAILQRVVQSILPILESPRG